MCKSTKPIVWNSTLDLTFKELKNLVCKAPSLLLLNPSKPFQVETKASHYAIGVVLYEDGKPITFECNKFDSTQCQYIIQEKELFSIIYGLKSWCHYLYGNCFVVTKDHDFLKYFCDQQDLKGRTTRWEDLIQDFDFAMYDIVKVP